MAPEDLLVPHAATDEEILRVHDPEYLRRVQAGEMERAEMRRIGFPWSAGMVERSRRSAGGTIEAGRTALGEGAAVNLAGGTHHAFRDRGEGYCVFNDVAIAIRALQAEGRVQRALVVDCDVHQGNGTAAIFAADPEVFTFSIHGRNNFPFHKEASDLDVELEDGTADEAYLAALAAGLDRAVPARARRSRLLRRGGRSPRARPPGAAQGLPRRPAGPRPAGVRALPAGRAAGDGGDGGRLQCRRVGDRRGAPADRAGGEALRRVSPANQRKAGNDIMTPIQRVHRAAASALVFALLLAGSLHAAGEGRIIATVLDEADAPVEGAKVLLTRPGTGYKLEKVSDKKGQVMLLILDATQDYQIHMEKPGYGPYEGPVKPKLEDTIRLTFTLPRPRRRRPAAAPKEVRRATRPSWPTTRGSPLLREERPQGARRRSSRRRRRSTPSWPRPRGRSPRSIWSSALCRRPGRGGPLPRPQAGTTPRAAGALRRPEG